MKVEYPLSKLIRTLDLLEVDNFGSGVCILYPQNTEGVSKHDGHIHFTQRHNLKVIMHTFFSTAAFILFLIYMDAFPASISVHYFPFWCPRRPKRVLYLLELEL